MVKRGQVTLFVILGILLIVIISFLIYIRSFYIQEGLERVEVSKDVSAFNEFVESCIRDDVNNGLDLLYRYGGYNGLTPQTKNILDETGSIMSINYVCPYQNKFRDIKSIEDDFELYLKDNLNCDLNKFESGLGNLDIKNVDVKFKDQGASISLEVKSIIINDNIVESFFVEVHTRFREIYQAEIEDTNSWVSKIAYLKTFEPVGHEEELRKLVGVFPNKGVVVTQNIPNDDVYMVSDGSGRILYFAC